VTPASIGHATRALAPVPERTSSGVGSPKSLRAHDILNGVSADSHDATVYSKVARKHLLEQYVSIVIRLFLKKIKFLLTSVIC
jgi:hypothetical protein